MEVVEVVARALAQAEGWDDGELIQEFDRSSAATVTQIGEYPGWESDVFPQHQRWEEYESKARAVVAALTASERLK